MLREIRTRITPATVIATVALVFALTGGAYAAGKILITSTKQISPKVLKSLKGATGKAGANGAVGPAGPAGPAGPTGAAGSGAPGAEGKQGPEGKEGKEGKNGKEGKEGKSGFTETLPSGKTETGTWAFDRQEGGLGGEHVPISFPIPLGAALGEGQVHLIAASGEELVFSEIGEPAEEVAPTKCGKALTPVGTVQKPAAAAGNLCIYIAKLNPAKVELEQVASQFIVDPSAECELISCLEAFGGPGGGTAPSGAVFESLVTVGEPANGAGTWAVTAP